MWAKMDIIVHYKKGEKKIQNMIDIGQMLPLQIVIDLLMDMCIRGFEPHGRLP